MITYETLLYCTKRRGHSCGFLRKLCASVQ
nr:MAG TPA: hypothetical protein [Caudoviricetes sp.]